MNFAKTTPILRIFDEALAKAFYIDFLGFQLDFEHRFAADLPLYMQVSKDQCVLHLSEHHGDSYPGAALRIETKGLAEFQEILTAKGYKNARPQIEEMPWGSQDMRLTDPFGNKLIFTDAIST